MRSIYLLRLFVTLFISSLLTAVYAQEDVLVEQTKVFIDSMIKAYAARDVETLVYYTEKGLNLASQLEVDTVIGKVYQLRAQYHDDYGLGDSAIFYYKKALEKLPVREAGGINSNIGLVYNRIQDYSNSIRYFEIAMNLAQQQENVGMQAQVATNLGIVFDNLGRTQKAKEYYLRAIDLRHKEGNKAKTLSSYYNLGLLELLPVKERYEYFEEGMALARELQSAFAIQMYLSLKAKIKWKEEKYDEMLAIAEPLYRDSVLQGAHLERVVLDDLAAAHVGLQNWDEARKLALELEKIGKTPQNFHALQNARRHLLKIYDATGEYQKYNEIAKAYYPAQDSLDDVNAQHEIAFLDAELRDVEQEQEIEQLNTTLKQRQVRRNWIIAVSLLVALVLSLLIYLRSRQVAHQKRIIDKEQQVSRELSRVNDELKQLDQLKSRFFTNISHELRTPLTLISTPVQSLLRKPESLSSSSEELQLVAKNTQKLQQLVEELLELSRIEAGKSELALSPVPLNSFCRQLFSAFESAAALKQINYQFESSLSEEATALLDKKRVAKIINNLLSNAFKFTDTGGEVKCEIGTSDEILMITVADTGRGIQPDDLPYVFDRYFQTKSKDMPTEGGTGVGLALARELAELHEGNLAVKSEWGKGTVFTLILPFVPNTENEVVVQKEIDADRQIMEVPEATITDVVPEEENMKKILIVEDNPDMQKLLQQILEEEYRLVFAGDGQEAWDLLSANDDRVKEINLILSDVMMPRMDGHALLEKIKGHEFWQQVPAVMLTAKASEESRLQALRMGIDDYLLKPFSPEELIARLHNLIDKYEQRQDLKHLGLNIDFEEAPSANQSWLKEMETICMDALDKKIPLNSQHLSSSIYISERQLLRKLKSLTGMSIKQYIQEVKLQKGKYLLENNTYTTVSEIAYACGFNSPGYFSTLYERRFGKRPTAYFT